LIEVKQQTQSGASRAQLARINSNSPGGGITPDAAATLPERLFNSRFLM